MSMNFFINVSNNKNKVAGSAFSIFIVVNNSRPKPMIKSSFGFLVGLRGLEPRTSTLSV